MSGATQLRREESDLLVGLNPAQVEAVTAPDVPLLVLAGAGSGKTRVLTHRVAYLVATGRARPAGVLAVTFTNKAAREMRGRLEQLVPGGVGRMWLGTFHACSARMLRERGALAGIPSDFVIYDEADRASLLRESMRAAGVDEKRLSLGSAGAEISRAKNDLMDVADYQASAHGYVEGQVARIYPQYQRLLEENRALDFDDLLLGAVRLLRDSPESQQHYRDRFGHVLVDEYQDTNRAQYEMLRLLVAEHRRVTVVGDPDQSVYSWRGADLRNILEFQRDYPDALVVPLEQNYRSTAVILRAAGAVIRENAMRLDKGLWTEGPEGDPVQIGQFYDEREEAGAVAREIRRLVGDGEAALGDVAVLYRTNAQSRALEEVFLGAGLPYRLVGGVRFYQRKEVKDLLAYLRLLANPRDRVAFERVVNVPRRGVGQQSLALLREAVVAAEGDLDAVLHTPQAAGVKGQAAAGMARFSQLMDDLRSFAASWPLVELFDRLLDRSGYRSLIRDGSPEAEDRWSNVMELRGLAAEQPQDPAFAVLPAFLEQLALAGELDSLDEEGPSAVTLITLHQVKGLEFPVVFITGAEEGLLPHSRSLDSEAQLEEERRLLYVGMTRARQHLYLSHCFQRHLYGSPRGATPSRFLKPLSITEGVHAWVAGRPAPFVAPAATRGQPLVLTRARDALAEAAVRPGARVPLEQRFQSGDHVEHARFGRGTIRSSEMTSSGEEVVIDFDGAGRRRFAVTDAVLRKLE